jgi:hypothetical protein
LHKTTQKTHLLLVVKKFLPGFRAELKVWTLDDGIDRASFLAKAAVDALMENKKVYQGQKNQRR